MAPPGEARPDWAILAEVGRRMGWHDAFDYAAPAEIFREYAALSGIAGKLGRDFDISGHADISDSGYETLEPFRWPFAGERSGGRFFGDGRFGVEVHSFQVQFGGKGDQFFHHLLGLWAVLAIPARNGDR